MHVLQIHKMIFSMIFWEFEIKCRFGSKWLFNLRHLASNVLLLLLSCYNFQQNRSITHLIQMNYISEYDAKQFCMIFWMICGTNLLEWLFAKSGNDIINGLIVVLKSKSLYSKQHHHNQQTVASQNVNVSASFSSLRYLPQL